MNSNVEVDSANNCLTCLHHVTSKLAASSATKALWETTIVYLDVELEVDSANSCLTCLHHGTLKIAASSATKGLWETSIVYLDVEQHDFCCCHKRYKRWHGEMLQFVCCRCLMGWILKKLSKWYWCCAVTPLRCDEVACKFLIFRLIGSYRAPQ